MTRLAFSMALLCVFISFSTFAQQQPGGGGNGGPGGGGPGGGNFDPAQFRQMMMDRVREQLTAPDDEWKVLQPKIEAVMAAQRDTRGGGGGPGGGPGAGNRQGDDSPVQRASRELRSLLENGAADGDQLKQKLDAYRDARAAAKKKLQDAQKGLVELLTPRQEAVLVNMGMLD